MCQMSLKFPAMFDENPPHTFDKSEKTQNNKKTQKTLSKLDLGGGVDISRVGVDIINVSVGTDIK